jgi:YaiO family outer membrane protein
MTLLPALSILFAVSASDAPLHLYDRSVPGLVEPADTSLPRRLPFGPAPATPLALVHERQEAGPSSWWMIGANYDVQSYASGNREDWHTYGVTLERRAPSVTIMAEVFQARRFGRTDEGAAIDAYYGLWRTAYAYTRIQGVPGADVLPELDLRTDLYQTIGGNWEASAGYRGMLYSEEEVHVVNATLARFIGSWHLRGQGGLVHQGGENVGFFGGSIRRMFDDGWGFVQLAAATGEEVILPGPLQLDIRGTHTIALRVQALVTETIGLIGGLNYDWLDRIPDRRGGTVGLRIRL